MTEEKPTARLQKEHQIIHKVVAAMVGLADRLETGHEIKRETLADVVKFMHGFADQLHEEKEESYLFPLLERKGLSVRSCPMRMLVHEHQLARSLVTRLADNADAYHGGDAAATNALVESLRRLADLYPLHVWREDLLLFPKADDVLSQEDDERLMEDFAAAEEDAGKDAFARYRELAERIESEVR